jgi:hypothetical protein
MASAAPEYTEKRKCWLISYIVLLTELLGKSGAHDLATNARRSLEVSPATLAARRANVYMKIKEE